jgi:AcrR family transcriptional regulator
VDQSLPDAVGERPKGRPRDAAARDRILRAAIDVFSSEGWRGFSLEAVARAAGVGKSTMYLRWSSRDELITEVYGEYVHDWVDPDSGSVREDLRALATAFGRVVDTPDGPFGLRFMVEAYTNPEFAAISAALRRTSVADAHRVVRRAKRRGQVRGDVSAAVILDALFGGIIHHLTTVDTRSAGGLYTSPQGRAFIDRLVDVVLAGAVAEG